MAFEKLRTIVITAIPKPRSPRKVTQDCRNPNSDLLPVKSFSVDRDSSCLAIHSAARLVSGSHAVRRFLTRGSLDELDHAVQLHRSRPGPPLLHRVYSFF
jgi:hypothetical protein